MKIKSQTQFNPVSPNKDGLQAFIEKRRSLRLPLFVLEIRWRKYNKVFIGHTQNISIGGLFMSTERPLQAGEQFPIEFVLPDRKTKINCTGEVTWTRSYAAEGAGSEGIGVRFVDLNDQKMKAIGQWIKKQETSKKKQA
ncbi:MAG TPA: PilZ domain-containing protein [Nitrospiria bacterium]|nr:PilZ domain-containing protein [Nitrospiria bacterium]